MPLETRKAHQPPDLKDWIQSKGKSYTFFKLMHDLEALGYVGPRGVKIKPLSSRVFPARDIHSLSISEKPASSGNTDNTSEPEYPDHQPQSAGSAEVTAWFGGLYGVDSPLPDYFDTLVESHNEDDEDRGKNLKAFLDLVSSRSYHQLYEIWKRLTPIFADNESLSECVRKPILSLCGLGHLKDTQADLVNFGPYMNQGMRNKWGLEHVIRRFLKIDVEVHEFEPARVYLSDMEKTRLGKSSSILGKTFRAVPYRETFATHIRVVCKGLVYEEYLDFLPGGHKQKLLSYLLFRYLPADVEYKLELILKKSEVHQVKFKLDSQNMRLGATTMIQRGDYGKDLRITREGLSVSTQPAAIQKIVEEVELERQLSNIA